MKGFTVDLFRVGHALDAALTCARCEKSRVVAPIDQRSGAVSSATHCDCPPIDGEAAGPAYVEPRGAA